MNNLLTLGKDKKVVFTLSIENGLYCVAMEVCGHKHHKKYYTDYYLAIAEMAKLDNMHIV